MRKKEDKKMMILWLDLISTILLAVAVIAIIIISSISIAKMEEHNRIITETSYSQIVDINLYGG